jgi:N-acetylated-alpha-linked acidic dipeptidase
MKFRWLTGLLVVAPLMSVRSEPEAANPPAAFLGYSAQNSVLQGQWESKFREAISASNIRENMRRLSARPHHVGSPYDKDNAQWILSKFKEWGFDARIETFNVLFPTPKSRLVEMLQPTVYRANLTEPAVDADST